MRLGAKGVVKEWFGDNSIDPHTNFTSLIIIATCCASKRHSLSKSPFTRCFPWVLIVSKMASSSPLPPSRNRAPTYQNLQQPPIPRPTHARHDSHPPQNYAPFPVRESSLSSDSSISGGTTPKPLYALGAQAAASNSSLLGGGSSAERAGSGIGIATSTTKNQSKGTAAAAASSVPWHYPQQHQQYQQIQHQHPQQPSQQQQMHHHNQAGSGGGTTRHGRQHSQGFFEPSLPTAAAAATPSLSNHATQSASNSQMPGQSQMTTSAMAAQAAMSQVSSRNSDRRRSQTTPDTQMASMAGSRKNSGGGAVSPEAGSANRSMMQPQQQLASRKPSNPPPLQTSQLPGSASTGMRDTPSSQIREISSAGPAPFRNTGNTAATAASAAFPRSPLASPENMHRQDVVSSPANERQSPALSTAPSITNFSKPAPKEKEKSGRRKLFSKPNKIHISKEAKDPTKRGPQTAGLYGSGANTPLYSHSTASLADLPSATTPKASIYSNVQANSSTSTIIPMTDKSFTTGNEKEKDKHRHNFLSRQKHKLRDKDDHHAYQLSSASSNSRPINDPAMPQPLYSFAPAPSSPSLGNKSISGLDLRHGGRALREKKKEEKAAASNFVPPMPSSAGTPNLDSSGFRDQNVPGPIPSLPEFANAPLQSWSNAALGPPSAGGAYGLPTDIGIPSQSLTGFGLQHMNTDDAWPFLKSRLLNIFEGEDLRLPVEDFNRLVSAHIQRCVQRRAPMSIVEDLRELLLTGFTSLEQTLRGIPEERIVPNLVELWNFVFGTVMPFMQAVFLPLDLEFKGRGATLHTTAEAADFWSSVPGVGLPKPSIAAANSSFAPGTSAADRDSTNLKALSSSPSSKSTPPYPALDVRNFVLATFRDTLIIPRHESLLFTFSRLSLDSINATPISQEPPSHATIPARPATAASSHSAGGGPFLDNPSSYNSQGSTLLDSNSSSLGARSRATSNTSAGSFHSSGSAGQNAFPGLHSTTGGVRLQNPLPRGPSRAAGAHITTVNTSGGSVPVPLDPAKITETAARMLQCVSVLAGVKGLSSSTPRAGIVRETRGGSDADRENNENDPELVARRKMERLGKELKLNWLGRGRTGRNRRGLVGRKLTMPQSGAGRSAAVGVGA